MAERPSADRTAEILFWYGRNPSRYDAEGRRRDAPRVDPEVILRLALGRSVKFANAAWNEPAKVDALGQAARAYVRRLFFRPDPTPYQVFGLEPGASPEAIKECFRLLMQLVHPDRQGEKKRWPDACAAQANWAYSTLRDQETRRTFEEEAEARAALQRAINRAAMAAEASQMPTVVWPKKSARETFGILRQVLPEWLTAGVGGYVRQHPAAAAFGALITISVLIIAASLWEGRDAPASLIRVARDEGPKPAQVAPAPMPAPDGSATASPRPADPAPSRSLHSGSTIVLASASPVDDVGRTGDAAPPPAPVSASAPTQAALALAQASLPPAAAALASAPAAVPPAAAALASALPSLPPAAPDPQVAASRGAAAERPEPSTAPQVTPLSVAVGALAPAPPAPTAPAPADREVEALLANFVDSYERGRVDAFAALFDDNADTNLRHGRVAIRGEYDELFRLSQWRRMQLTRISWRPVGDRAVAKGELTVKIGWRDGREVEQRVNVDMEFVRRDGRVVIAKLSHHAKNP